MGVWHFMSTNILNLDDSLRWVVQPKFLSVNFRRKTVRCVLDRIPAGLPVQFWVLQSREKLIFLSDNQILIPRLFLLHKKNGDLFPRYTNRSVTVIYVNNLLTWYICEIRKYFYPFQERGGAPCDTRSAIIILTTVAIHQQQDLCTLEFSFTGTVGLSGKAFFNNLFGEVCFELRPKCLLH
jgi:hypothetical protein